MVEAFYYVADNIRSCSGCQQDRDRQKRRVCRRHRLRWLGYELKIEDMAFETILASVNSGKADFGAAGMTVTPAREESVDFTDTYANATQVVIVRK